MIEHPKQNIIGIVYDFDGTLSPDNMQEKTIFKEYNIQKDDFWSKTQALVDHHQYERTLAYLKLMLHDPMFQDKPLTRELMGRLAKEQIRYYEGVEQYFEHIDQFVREIREAQELDIHIEHYVVSSGMKELLNGCSISKYFKKIYACEFDYDGDKPVFPKLVINDTNKTQFLFRINKGKLSLSEDINSHMPENERPIPFRNMIYIGDGNTDIPSMTVTQKSGGHAIAVYPPGKPVPEDIKRMVAEGRADHFAAADYSPDRLLFRIIKQTIRKIVQTMAYHVSSDKSREWVRKNT